MTKFGRLRNVLVAFRTTSKTPELDDGKPSRPVLKTSGCTDVFASFNYPAIATGYQSVKQGKTADLCEPYLGGVARAKQVFMKSNSEEIPPTSPRWGEVGGGH